MPEVRDAGRADGGSAAAAGEQAELIARLSAVREELLEVAEGWHPWISGREADRDASARNLLQYLALRRHDLRDLQDPLIALGLSSLGGSEGRGLGASQTDASSWRLPCGTGVQLDLDRDPGALVAVRRRLACTPCASDAHFNLATVFQVAPPVLALRPADPDEHAIAVSAVADRDGCSVAHCADR